MSEKSNMVFYEDLEKQVREILATKEEGRRAAFRL